MTNLAALQADLTRIAGELDRIAAELASMVPGNPDRYDLMLEAYNRIGGVSAEVRRANGCISLAIRKEMGG